MNITGITNHLKFEHIFSNCRIDGKICWLKVSMIRDLPNDFIIKYFTKLKFYGIEKNQSLSSEIISQYRDKLNWYSLLKYQDIPEDCIKENIDIIKRQNLWSLLFKTQNLSLDFLLDHINMIRGNEKLMASLEMNTSVSPSTKEKIRSFVL